MLFFWQRREVPDFISAYEAAQHIDTSLPWREARYCVIDVETSGLDSRRDVLLAIGMVDIQAGRVRLDSHWYSLIRPPEGMLVDAGSIRIHGLTRAELATAPTPEEILPQLLQRLSGAVLVVHVAQVDVQFINRALRDRWKARLRGPILDTARLAMTLHQHAQLLGEASPDMPAPAIQLRALAEGFGLPTYAQHNALNDALTTAQLFLAQATRLAGQGRKTLKGLLRSGGV